MGQERRPWVRGQSSSGSAIAFAYVQYVEISVNAARACRPSC